MDQTTARQAQGYGWLQRLEGMTPDQAFQAQQDEYAMLRDTPDAYGAALVDSPAKQQRWLDVTDARFLRVGCMDERCTARNVGVAGAGILETDWLDYFSHVQEMATEHEGTIVAVESHAGCGAASLAKEQRHDPRPVDDIAAESAEQSAVHLGIAPVAQERFSIPFHPARIIYNTGTPTFNPEALGMLPGFVISRPYHRQSDATKLETTIATSIALGEHGYGNRFTAENPLLIVIIPGWNNEWTAERLAAEANDIDVDGVVERVVVLNVPAHPAAATLTA